MTQNLPSTLSDPSIYDLSDEEVMRLAKLAVEAKQKAYCMPSTLLVLGDVSTGSARAPVFRPCPWQTSTPPLPLGSPTPSNLTSSVPLSFLAPNSAPSSLIPPGPYSHFPVGAALLLFDGTYHTGSNVEIASTPVGICAERCALAPVIASFKRSQEYADASPSLLNIPVIRGLAVSTNVDPPSSPCGMCRQFIREFCSGEMKIWMYGGRWDRGERDGDEGDDEGEGKVVVVKTIGELLPMSFGRDDLDRGRKP